MSQIKPIALGKEEMKNVAVLFVVTIARTHLVIIRGEIVQVVITEQQDHLIRMAVVEVDDVHQTMQGSEFTYPLVGIRIHIIP